MDSGVTTPSRESAADATRVPQLEQVPMGVPLGFAGQLRALQQAQREQTERITLLETENAELKNQLEAKIVSLAVRVEQLEQYNEHLSARRRELVGQLLNLRTLHLDADNAFQMRAADIQPDDSEGVLGLCNTQIMTTLSHHQRAIAQIRTSAQYQYQQYSAFPPQRQPSVMPPRSGRAYPHWYTKHGYCLKHGTAYPCFTCDRAFENTPVPPKPEELSKPSAPEDNPPSS